MKPAAKNIGESHETEPRYIVAVQLKTLTAVGIATRNVRAEKMVEAMKEGNWDKAQQELNKLKEQLKAGKLDGAGKKELQKQLSQLQKKLEQARSYSYNFCLLWFLLCLSRKYDTGFCGFLCF